MPVYELRGVEVDFPHDAYPCQLAYMEKVIQALQEGTNALLESPTGTGKTLCLLCATLAWREAMKRQKREAAKVAVAVGSTEGSKSWAQTLKEGLAELQTEEPWRIPPIIYSSRTHSQLAQVIKELKRTNYRPRSTVIGSRQQLCVNPAIAKLQGNLLNHACRTASRARSCSWGNRVDKFMKDRPEINSQPMDIEDLVAVGTGPRGPCPFFLARSLASTSEIIFMPYNYLVDPVTRAGLKIDWQECIMIFDEAHNVTERCMEASSWDLPAGVLAGCIQETLLAAEVAARRRDTDGTTDQGQGPGAVQRYSQMTTDLILLQRILKRLEDAVADIANRLGGPNGFTAPGRYLFELLESIGLKPANFLLMSSLLDDAVELLSDDAIQQGRRTKSQAGNYKLTVLAEALRLAFGTLEGPPGQSSAPVEGFRVHIRKERVKGHEVPTLSFWCFSAAVTMQQLQALKVRSFILTSGTLTPLSSFAAELGSPFPIQLENPHVIDPRQVWIGVIPVGPGGQALNSSYGSRDKQEYKQDLGLAIARFSALVPDGLLVFFPSYIVLETCIDYWKRTENRSWKAFTTIWETITHKKQAVVEPRESSAFSQAAEDFRMKLKDPSSSGAIFFAVCRGKVSEGLDFADRAGRGVIITGIPFAMHKDPKVMIQRDVLDQNLRKAREELARRAPRGSGRLQGPPLGISGETWYMQQAARSVNQAIGSRHPASLRLWSHLAV
eukprot:jgi/Botrbrau1/18521/Bobra.0072s0096.1